jgi:hypothetical protein
MWPMLTSNCVFSTDEGQLDKPNDREGGTTPILAYWPEPVAANGSLGHPHGGFE